jgi:hypothetical protein
LARIILSHALLESIRFVMSRRECRDIYRLINTHGIENQLGPNTSREDGLFNHLSTELPEIYVQGGRHRPVHSSRIYWLRPYLN